MRKTQRQVSDGVFSSTARADMRSAVDWAFRRTAMALDQHEVEIGLREVGRVRSVGRGVAEIEGAPGVRSEELLRFPGDALGMAFNLDEDAVGVILFDQTSRVEAGAEVHRTGRVLDVPVGNALLGRVVDAMGRPLDGRGPVRATDRLPVERPAPGIMERAPVTTPLQTGLKVIDALFPIGRGQRELILGDRQTGKTAVAVDTIVNQRGTDMVAVYCAIGQRASAVARVVAELERGGVMESCIVMMASGEETAGHRFIAPYAATSMGERLMEEGRDVLIVYDDLTHHARAYRELSLLLRRPPGREAYPGDIFYVHSRLLERSTHLRKERGGGSLTALPIVETQAQNLAAYIPTNLISITDGQIYLSPLIFRQGFLPAVDVGLSVSRVGGKAQLPAYRAVTADLRLSYAQFQELERFTRYGARLEPEKQRTLERGRRVREVFKQFQYQPLDVLSQMGIFLSVTSGLFDALPLVEISAAEAVLSAGLPGELGPLAGRIAEGSPLDEADIDVVREKAGGLLRSWRPDLYAQAPTSVTTGEHDSGNS